MVVTRPCCPSLVGSAMLRHTAPSQLAAMPCRPSTHPLSASHKSYLADKAPLSQQVQELRQWLTTPVVLSREGLSQGIVSWDNIKRSICLLLRYCHEYKQVTQPKVQLFLFHSLHLPTFWSDGVQLAFPHRKTTITSGLGKSRAKAQG